MRTPPLCQRGFCLRRVFAVPFLLVVASCASGKISGQTADGDAVAGPLPDDGGAHDGAASSDAHLYDAGVADAKLQDGNTGAPGITSIGYTWLPRGSNFTIVGSNFTPDSQVKIGDVLQPIVVKSSVELEVTAVDSQTVLGETDLVVMNALGQSNAFAVNVVECKLSPSVLIRGGSASLTVSAGSFAAGATQVMLDGQTIAAQSVSANKITIGPIPADAAEKLSTLAISSGGQAYAPLKVNVSHLYVSEVDSDTDGADTLEFIEITSGVADATMDGYVVVLFNGANLESYASYDLGLSGPTSSNGVLLLGNSSVIPTPGRIFANQTLQNGADAVALYHGTVGDFPSGTALGSIGLIDAVVYGTGDSDNAGLLDALYMPGPSRLQIDEDKNQSRETQSVQRCSDSLRDGQAWQVADPTPGADNACTPQ